jgi:hypothetical protein
VTIVMFGNPTQTKCMIHTAKSLEKHMPFAVQSVISCRALNSRLGGFLLALSFVGAVVSCGAAPDDQPPRGCVN